MKIILPLITLLSLSAQASPISEANNSFGFALYRELARERGNLFLSPYSVATALAMTSAGARGQTLEEMRKTLQLGSSTHADALNLRKSLQSEGSDKPILATANRLWGKSGQKYHSEFLELTAKNYGASLTPLDYAASPEAARKKINDWVAEQTRQKILDLMPEGSINAQTDLVLTNAIYFKGSWISPFEKKDTREESFHPEGESFVQKPFLHQEGRFFYAETESFKAVRLPYKGNELAMTLLLPKPGKSLSLLTKESFSLLGKAFMLQPVQVSFPKFRLEYRQQLETLLPKLGMRLAFNPDAADFSGMRELKGGERLFISKVVHKAFVEVDEEGTEAAAATGVVMAPTMAAMNPEPPKRFHADRPFAFAIEHLPSGTVLFLGRVSHP